MESDKSTDNEIELTSTSSCGMGKLLSTNKEEKSDSNDTLPTSSTDASTSFKATNLGKSVQLHFLFISEDNELNWLYNLAFLYCYNLKLYIFLN